EMELAKPRWSEDPAAIEAMAGETGKAAAVPGDHAALAKTWDRIAAEVKLLPHQRAILEAELQTVHTYLALREAGKHYLMRGYGLIRRYLVELDRRFDLDGGIFFLTPADLPRLELGDAKDAKLRTDLQASIDKARRRRTLALTLPVPAVLFSDDLE